MNSFPLHVNVTILITFALIFFLFMRDKLRKQNMNTSLLILIIFSKMQRALHLPKKRYNKTVAAISLYAIQKKTRQKKYHSYFGYLILELKEPNNSEFGDPSSLYRSPSHVYMYMFKKAFKKSKILWFEPVCFSFLGLRKVLTDNSMPSKLFKVISTTFIPKCLGISQGVSITLFSCQHTVWRRNYSLLKSKACDVNKFK